MHKPASPTDGDLLKRARSRDHDAFRLLVERYEGKVAATIISMLGAGAEADDVGQEVFIRFYEAMDQFREEASLGTYLTRIAINESLKALRRRRRWSKRFFSRDEPGTLVDDALPEAPGDLEEREQVRLVRSALQHLSDDHRAVVVLRMLEGYSTRETAHLLDIPEGTVMSRLSRALDHLEQLLGPLFDDVAP